MAEFEVNVVKIDSVKEHSNADRLTIVRIAGYSCIANKKEDGSWRYQEGDLVVYIPEASVVPVWMLQKLNMWNEEKNQGFLAGTRGDRVKAIKLRGVISQGILYPVKKFGDQLNDLFVETEDDTVFVHEGVDVSEILSIKKYEPIIPASMSGEVAAIAELAFKYDVENYQKYPDILQEGEEVRFTEKLHGTCMCIGLIPELNHPEMPFDGNAVVFSKGLGSRGLMFKDNGANERNVYIQMFHKLNNPDSGSIGIGHRIELMRAHGQFGLTIGMPVFILGEIFGAGIQDLKYGHQNNDKSFRGFDIYIGHPGTGFYLDFDEKEEFFKELGVDQVPVLYKGPWAESVAAEYSKGTDSISNSHVREGIVVNTANERRCDEIGRVQLKFINPKYLLRKGGTELN